MKIFHRLWLVGAVAVLGMAVTASPVVAITNGDPDTDDPHLNVGILYMSELPAFVYGMCSGSLLSADEFLVAGHCTAAMSAYQAMGLLAPDEVFVSFDADFGFDVETGLISTANPVAVTGWATHPAYVNAMGILKNDVGVIHLATPQTYAPVELPEAGFLSEQAAAGELRGRDFVNVGYGLNGLDRSMNSPRAQIRWDLQRTVSETAFVALSSNNLMQDGGACAGDSGGPRFYGGDEENLVVAITASGSARCGLLDASQRIDLEPVLEWLELYR